MRNIELKAQLYDLAAAREIARRVANDYVSPQEQTDTYFHCARGRLKLREIEGLVAQLIWYDRPDELQASPSDYLLVPVERPEELKNLLTAAHGVRVVVKKRREIFMVCNVRVHLDQVEGLGAFLEFEAVLSPEADETPSRKVLDYLREQFGVTDDTLLPGSYAEMLEENPSYRNPSDC
ncbi:MAG: class IV adenylate cyclase [Pirellulales bacterium]|nr:class IV adenylate cyclase [Pirellulales bacterium]